MAPSVRFTVHQYNGYAEDRTFCSATLHTRRALMAEWRKAGCPTLPATLRGINITIHALPTCDACGVGLTIDEQVNSDPRYYTNCDACSTSRF